MKKYLAVLFVLAFAMALAIFPVSAASSRAGLYTCQDNSNCGWIFGTGTQFVQRENGDSLAVVNDGATDTNCAYFTFTGTSVTVYSAGVAGGSAAAYAYLDGNSQPAIDFTDFSDWAESSSVAVYSATGLAWGPHMFSVCANGDTIIVDYAVVDPGVAPTRTRTPTRTPVTKTVTSTRTPVFTRTPTTERTVTSTKTPVFTKSPTLTRTITNTRTVTSTRTETSTRTATKTRTLTITLTLSPTLTETPTP